MTPEKHDQLVAKGMEVVERVLTREQCMFCALPWKVQAWRIYLQAREWMCEDHFEERSQMYAYQVERTRGA